jgi:hypothetical protein
MICGNLFKMRKDRPNITCSFHCNLEYRRIVKKKAPIKKETIKKQKTVIKIKCDYCGIEHERKFKNNNKCGKVFCGQDCYVKYIKEFGSINPKQPILKINHICKYCGKHFLTHNFRKNVQYCSVTCSNNDFRRDFKCKTCGKLVKIANHRENKYCSIECSNKGVDKRNSKFSKSVFNFLSKYFNNIECEKYISSDNKRYSIDFVIDNFAIECYGDYWHCNPKKYSEDYYNSRTRKSANETWNFDKLREQYLETKKYIVIIIWESDWYNKSNDEQERVKRLIYEIRKN